MAIKIPKKVIEQIVREVAIDIIKEEMKPIKESIKKIVGKAMVEVLTEKFIRSVVIEESRKVVVPPQSRGKRNFIEESEDMIETDPDDDVPAIDEDVLEENINYGLRERTSANLPRANAPIPKTNVMQKLRQQTVSQAQLAQQRKQNVPNAIKAIKNDQVREAVMQSSRGSQITETSGKAAKARSQVENEIMMANAQVPDELKDPTGAGVDLRAIAQMTNSDGSWGEIFDKLNG